MKALVGSIVLLAMGIGFLALSGNGQFLRFTSRLALRPHIASLAARSAALIVIVLSAVCFLVFLARLAGIVS